MELKLIEGGAERLLYKFIEGEITDTRLMGVLGLHLHWRADGEVSDEFDKHQFFYYDIEELGLDQLAVYVGNEPIGIELAIKTLFGGLGGKMVPIYEREARYLVNYFVAETMKKGEPLPATIEELRFILDAPVTLSEGEKYVLGKKMCVDLATDYAACHYFLMRLTGHDIEGAALISSQPLSAKLAEEGINAFGIPDRQPATFLRNSIKPVDVDKEGTFTCVCESLVETNDGYYMVFSELAVRDQIIRSAKLKTRFHITDMEASLQLRRSEYISVYEISGEQKEFDISFSAFSIGCTVSTHENGIMYMQFKPDNNHVEQAVFNLNDDVRAIYFVTESGQMLVSAYTEDAISRAESDIRSSHLRELVFSTNRYKFLDSVIYDFAQSGFDDFNAFVETIEE